jgi:hypothetical protein
MELRTDDELTVTPSQVSSPANRAKSTSTTGAGATRLSGWTRTTVNFWLDASMLAVFVAMVWTATVVRFVFPPAVASKEWTLWSWNVDQWIGLHYATLCLFTLLVVLHLMLHWSWVCGVIATRFLKRADGKKQSLDEGSRTLWGVGLLILLLNFMGLAIAAAVLSIKGPM